MKISIVVGLGFGDEGKGMVTSKLVEKADNPMVIRFNGGHQAGHTVLEDGHRHVFSSFGSGTLQGAPTYWSEYCTVYPTGLLKEFDLLREFFPILYIDPESPVTTPFDVFFNQHHGNKHGTVGVGFGATMQRQEHYYSLLARDLLYPKVLSIKLDMIAKYYGIEDDSIKKDFMDDVARMLSYPAEIIIGQPPPHKGDLIFEGAQGIMLDQNYGFFPYVTRSNTTSANAFNFIIKRGIKCDRLMVFMVTRAYQTRHGKGPMTSEGVITLTNNEFETNRYNEYQEDFRTGPFDPDLVRYAIDCEYQSSGEAEKAVVMTCVDQVTEIPELKVKYPVLYNSSPEGDFI